MRWAQIGVSEATGFVRKWWSKVAQRAKRDMVIEILKFSN